MIGLVSLLYQRLLLPLLTLPEAEVSHNLVLRLLRLASPLAGLLQPSGDPRLRVSAFGLEFPNPIGLAAGFDKNGVAVPALAALGFGHVEVGTVTPRPQPGRPRPRLFRLEKDQALINRLGFPSQGAAAVAANLSHLKRRRLVLGINVGPNVGSVGIEDFVQAARMVAPYADYLTINVSSPNTAGLHGMQQAETLAGLLAALDWLDKPLLVKVSPDLSDGEFQDMLDVLCANAAAGVVVANTTVDRPPHLQGSAEGGLSGRPLRERATQLVSKAYRHTAAKLPIIGVGGVATAQDALDKIEAGACLVQLYTGFVYQGPFAARDIALGLLRELDRRGAASIQELIGSASD
jgi:dihydroorotate dehydrogenase